MALLKNNPFKPGSIGYRTYEKARAASDQEVNQPYQQYLQAGAAAVPKLYAPAYADISRQFAPQFAGARNYLAGNPAMASSGAGNKLNRLLLTGAYGQLTDRMAGSAANVQSGGLDLLSQLLQRRVEQRYAERNKKKKGGIGGVIGGIAGSVLGPMGSAVGSNLGNKLVPL